MSQESESQDVQLKLYWPVLMVLTSQFSSWIADVYWLVQKKTINIQVRRHPYDYLVWSPALYKP